VKQVELNTIASSFGCLSTLVTRLHRYILSRSDVPDVVSCGELARYTWRSCCNTSVEHTFAASLPEFPQGLNSHGDMMVWMPKRTISSIGHALSSWVKFAG